MKKRASNIETARAKKSKVEAQLRVEKAQAQIDAKKELKRTCQTRAKIWLDEHGYSMKITELSGTLFFHYLATVCPHFGLDLRVDGYKESRSCYLRVYDYKNHNNFNSISLYNNEFIPWNSDDIADKTHWAHLKDELALRGLRLEIVQTQVPVLSLFPELTQTVSELTFHLLE